MNVISKRQSYTVTNLCSPLVFYYPKCDTHLPCHQALKQFDVFGALVARMH